MEKTTRHLVNPVALQNCSVKWVDLKAQVLDISFVRLVIEVNEPWPNIAENQAINLEFTLGTHQFAADLTVQARGENWIRFRFERIVPSAQAHLRAFLSPKKVGESIFQDRATNEIHHFHGLNESELWFNEAGAVLFTYLDPLDTQSQFLVRVSDHSGLLKIGKMSRVDYMALESLDSEVAILTLSDREMYARLGECRDIVTNFRPSGQQEFHLKQRLLKLISENLYSTSHRVDFSPPRSSRVVSHSLEN